MTRCRRRRTDLAFRRPVAAFAAFVVVLTLLSHSVSYAIAATASESDADHAEQQAEAPTPPPKNPQTPYLKEILLGRCYDFPPTSGAGGGANPDDCPILVGNLVSSFESSIDSDVTIGSYSKYFDVADFAPPKDRALFVSKFSVENRRGRRGRKPYPPFVRVRDTPGGSLMAGLTFCGSDVRSDCPVQGGAWGSFWEGAHEKFAEGASGIVRAIVYEEEEEEEYNDSGGGADDGAPPPPPPPAASSSSSMMLEVAFPKLDVTKITAFAVFLVPPENAPSSSSDDEAVVVTDPAGYKATPSVNCDTSETYAKLKARLQKMGMKKDLIGCTVDPNLTHLRLCEDTPDAPHCGGEIVDMAKDNADGDEEEQATDDAGSDDDEATPSSAAAAASTGDFYQDAKRRKHHRRGTGHRWLLGRLFWVFVIGSVIFYITKRTNDREQRFHNPNHHGDAVPMGQYQV